MAFYAVISSFPDGQMPDDLADRSDRVARAIAAELPSLHGQWVMDWALRDSDIQAIDIVAADARADVDRAAELISEHGGCQARVAEAMTWAYVTGQHRP
jgi:hypothetical protein